jgi:two-component system NtrC family sensor kinase
MNLCVNARDAMPGGGVVQLIGQNRSLAANQNPDPASIFNTGSNISDLAGDFVALTLSDGGAGISAENLKRVFEPFFTTKEIGKGTGLGLSQVYGFAQQSGGRAAIESVLGQGTSVTIYLPRARVASGAEAAQDRPAMEHGTGTVLLVEDDEDVAKMAARMLAMIGYKSQHVLDARTALTLLLGGQHFDLLFSDIVMPGDMNGLDLARKVRQHFPRLPILLATGYSRAAADVHRDGFSIIAKPYRADALAAAIASALRHKTAEDSQGTG